MEAADREAAKPFDRRALSMPKLDAAAHAFVHPNGEYWMGRERSEP
jgi:hypothetical protein